jgi:hypothetical protein
LPTLKERQMRSLSSVSTWRIGIHSKYARTLPQTDAAEALAAENGARVCFALCELEVANLALYGVVAIGTAGVIRVLR